MPRRALVALLLAGCATRPAPSVAWRFEGLDARGEVRVVHLDALDAPLAVRTDSYVTETIIEPRLRLRLERTRALTDVPQAVTRALPGAIHSKLDPAWNGHFRVGQLPWGARRRVETALRRDDPRGLDEALAVTAPQVGGAATLFTWVRQLEGVPLTTETLPGDQVETPAGPILLDLFEEPYRVNARIGLALVSEDGHVILRYEHDAAALLTPHRSTDHVGRQLARDLARQIAPMWPDDPRLWRHDQPLGTEPAPPILALDEAPARPDPDLRPTPGALPRKAALEGAP